MTRAARAQISHAGLRLSASAFPPDIASRLDEVFEFVMLPGSRQPAGVNLRAGRKCKQMVTRTGFEPVLPP